MTSTSDDISTKPKRASKPKAPKPPSLQERVLAELTRWKDANTPYITARELAERIGEPVDKLPGKLAGKAFQGKVVIAKKVPNAPVLLADDAQTFANSDDLLRFAVAEAKSVEPGPWEVAKFLKLPKLDKAIATKFQEALETRVGNGTLPSDLRDQIVPKQPPPLPLPERIVQELNRLKSTRGTYPITATALAQNLREPTELLASKLAGKPLQGKVVIAKKHPSTLVALSEDVDLLANSDALLRFAVSEASAKKPGPWTIDAFLKSAALEKNTSLAFRKVFEPKLAQGKLPPDLRDSFPRSYTVNEIGATLFKVLGSQKGLGPESYPVLESRLGELCGLPVKKDQIKQALQSPEFARDTTSIKKGKAQYYILKADVNADGLEGAIVAAEAKSKTKSTAFSVDELVGVLAAKESPRYDVLRQAFSEAVSRNTVPKGVGVLVVEGKPVLFRLSRINQGTTNSAPPSTHATAPTPNAAGFASAFDAAFSRLLSRAGGQNLIKVFDLRRELSEYGRDSFDLGLRHLREARRYTMNSHEGAATKLSSDEIDAGIREGGSNLVYVSRKGGAHG